MNGAQHVRSGEVSYNKEYKRKLFINRIEEYVLLAIISLTVIFVGFVTIKGPIRTGSGYIYPTYLEAKNGSNVVVTDHEDSFGGRLYNGLAKQDLIYGKVIVGNYGTLTQTGDVYTVTQDGKTFPTSVKINDKHGRYLNNEYIIQITKGKNKNKQILVSGEQVQTLK